MTLPALRNWVVLASAIALGASAFYVFLPGIAQAIVRALLWTRYRLRIRGRENVPKTGPVLLAANHLTWLDGFFLAAVCPRHGRALVNADLINRPVIRPLALRAGIIPTPFSGPRAIRAAIAATRKALDDGQAVGIFPEGQISRIGLTLPFYRGLEVILGGRSDVPVVPVAFDNLWGSLYSRSGGRFFRKWPKGLRRTVNVVIGPPVAPPLTAFAVRQALLEALVHAYAMREHPSPPPETVDPSLPRWEHPELGLLTGSTADLTLKDVHQVGQKPGTVGLPLPGVAVRAVDDAGNPLGPDAEGRLQALVAGKGDWTDTGARGRLDSDGFVTLATSG